MGYLRRIWQNKKTKEYVDSQLRECERTNLVYDTETKVIYYLFEDCMSPLISENGRFCRWFGGEIVEIIN